MSLERASDPAHPIPECSKCGKQRAYLAEIRGQTLYAPCLTCYPADDEKLARQDARSAAFRAAGSVLARIVAANPIEESYARYTAKDASLANTELTEHTEDGLGRCRDLFAAFQEKPSGVGLSGFGLVGPKGTGKTWLAVALVRDLRAAGIPAMLYTVSDLLAAIQANWGDERKEAAFREMLVTCPLLVLDDLGKEPYKKNSWSLSTLFDVVNARWNRDLPIVVTANATAQETLTKKYAGDDVFDAIVDRLEGIFDLAWSEVSGDSRRRS